MRAGSRERGFSYIVVMFALALFGIGLAQVGERWSEVSRRDKEAELIRAGSDVVRAIEAYYVKSPGAAKAFPKSWDDLTEDRRFVGVQRHLRRVPVDPFTKRADWIVVRAGDGGIAGIQSRHDGKPLRQRALVLDWTTAAPIPAASRYAEWKFVYQPM
jgi:type II secretory pathway pseudopilin PulG